MSDKGLRKKYRELLRAPINREMRSRLANGAPSILANNCNGGVIAHDLGLRFRTPTVNLYFPFPDYIRFLQRLDHYLSLPPEAMESIGGGRLTRNAPAGLSRTSEWPSFTIRLSRLLVTSGSSAHHALTDRTFSSCLRSVTVAWRMMYARLTSFPLNTRLPLRRNRCQIAKAQFTSQGSQTETRSACSQITCRSSRAVELSTNSTL